MAERFNLKQMLREIQDDQSVKKVSDRRLSRDGLKKYVACIVHFVI